ncbi:hypothetical protein T440DRAFT_535780 [Plenodomus tracheiphilus IPT5]|uniref:Uncharacterized protein n=1 Tax=Plenodomus tracheiphilus IPT5 TaxID=1408161 RepID=A0A6A7BJJ3_9PLEO|nr:hypothetical protein T440DRAFT_535780 [Plenodomus tracheiphilus IPT5]
MELDSDAVLDDESALKYARYYGLCVDYATEDLRIRDLAAPSDDKIDRDLRDLSITITTDLTSELIRERLAVSRDAALLLKSVHALQVAPTEDAPIVDRRKWMLSLRQEVPILSTDHDLDILSFGSAALPDLKNLKIPSEVTNVESDEGFEWPSKYFAYPAQCEEQVKAEKLGVTKDVLLCLQSAIRDDYQPQDLEDAIDAEVNGDSVTVEAKALEQQIMNADSLRRQGSGSSDSMLLDIINPQQISPLSEYKEPPVLKRRAEDLKVEGPLTPPMFSTSPMKKLKSVSFAEILAEYIPTMKPVHSGDDGDISSVDFDDYDDFLKEIEPLVAEVKRKVENEQLSGADTTARIDIPDLDFTLPIAPWNTYTLSHSGRHKSSETELDAQAKFLLRIKREDLKTATSWHGVSALERQLQWSIFTTHVSSIQLEEKLHGETELNKTLAELTTGNIAISASLVWKPDGLRILDEDEEEEEIESEDVEEQRGVEAVVRKRKLEMEEEVAEQMHKRAAIQSGVYSIGHAQHDQTRPASRHRSTQPRKESGNELMFGGFSASTALHKFMETRGRSIQPAQLQTKLPIQMNHALPVRSRAASHEVAISPAREISTQLPTIEIEKNPHHIAIPEHLPPGSFIVSSTLLHRRSLLKQIEHLYLSAEIIYRDYTLPHSPSQETDMILSPSTGLLFTTLQQIKQRSLPGQPTRSPLKQRVLALQPRYERLVVIISEGLTREMEQKGSSRPSDARDEEALLQFETFTGKLEGEVLIEFVKGGEMAFARRVVGIMAQYGLAYGSVDIGDIKPLAVETSWEIFLRRAGFNPFAAQVIVASLKDTMEMQIPRSFSSPSAILEYQDSVRVSGLPAFLMMSGDERIRHFQAVMGGARILKRVGAVLDQEWVSAVHGFKV